jgi:hypothetical protein
MESGEIGRDDVLSGRLTALEHATTGVARANVVATALALSGLQSTVRGLASVVGTSSPLTGMHLWVTTTMGLIIAQARADEMLDRNGTPEPYRSILRGEMTDITSSLRPDRPVNQPTPWWVWSQRGTAQTQPVNTHFSVEGFTRNGYVLPLDGITQQRYIRRGSVLGQIPSDETCIIQPPEWRSQAPRNTSNTIIRLGGTWTVVGAYPGADYVRIIVEETGTDRRFCFCDRTTIYENETAASEPYDGTLQAIPYGVKWHMIIRLCERE